MKHPKTITELTPKAKAAWDAICASGQLEVRNHGYGGLILEDGTKINGQIVKNLFWANLVGPQSINASGQCVRVVTGTIK
jgi:hypothetical protein